MLAIPTVSPATTNPNKPKRDSSAKCLTLPDEVVPSCSKASTSKQSLPVQTNKTKKNQCISNGDWICGVCMENYNYVKKKNGKKWVQCSYCLTPYHETCQSFDDFDEVFMCGRCCELESDTEK